MNQSQLKELLWYDAQTGVFRWRFSTSQRVKPWSEAGCHLNGYKTITVKSKPIYAHRLAWLYMTGSLPINQIDHIDGNRQNNAWCNLREATPKQNAENRKLHHDNKSGYRGVSWNQKQKKWKASVTHNGVQIYLGFYKTPEEAAQVVEQKRASLYTHDVNRAR